MVQGQFVRAHLGSVLSGAMIALLLVLTPERTSAESAPWPSVYLADPIVGLVHPAQVTHADDGSGRLFIVELPGRVRIVRNGQLEATPFLDITTLSTCAGAGLLSVAFPPASGAPTHAYVAYANAGCDLVVARYTVSANPDVADASSAEILLTVPNINAGAPGHLGGQLAFGPDGYLYVSKGDGTAAGDPGNLAQDPSSLNGKLLRLEVHAGVPGYTVPSSNPFVGVAGVREEIWASGLRNPFHFAFDSLTSDLYISDVGQDTWEEVNFQQATDPGGLNYGWRIMEGAGCYLGANCDLNGLTLPVFTYAHANGDCDINGGEVYRGTLEPEFDGIYFAGDFCSGRIRGVRQGMSGWEGAVLKDTNLAITHLGSDEAGRFYVADYKRGVVYRLTSTAAAADLALTMSRTPNPVSVGAQVTFTLQASNVGQTTALDVAVTDTLPASLRLVSASTTLGSCSTNVSAGSVNCTTISLAPGQTLDVTLVATTLAVDNAINSAQVSADAPDPDLANNVASATTNITPVANLILTHADSPDPVPLGGAVTYTLTTTNRGPSPASGVELDDTLPVAMSPISAAPSQGDCTISGSTISCTLGAMATNATATVTVQATSVAAGRVTATAQVAGAEFDPVTSDNTRSTTTTVVGLSSVSVAAATIAGCKPSTGTVKLTAAAPPAGMTVALSSTLPSVTVPTAVVVPAGASSATFPISTVPVAVKATGSVNAAFAGVTRNAAVTVRPIGVGALTLVPSTTPGGTTATANIDLECPAAPGDITVSVSSNRTVAARPVVGSVVVPAGATSTQVGVAAQPTTIVRTATIKATANTVAKTAVLTVTP